MSAGDAPGPPPAGLRRRLADPRPLVAVELRPPRRHLQGERAVEAWIDAYHAIRRIACMDTAVFLTDDAVGIPEEENLSHLVRNLGPDAPRGRIVPFLTLKHPIDYCERYADRARREAVPGLVVLGGDPQDGAPRCLPHSWQLRERLRRAHPRLLLGGWANPYRDPAEQAAFLAEHVGELDFVLTQIVSHHRPEPVAAFVEELERRVPGLPVFGGVFVYRSANRRTLDMLSSYLPVPADELAEDFGERGLDSEEVAAATLRWLHGLGLSRFYLSNLPTAGAADRICRIAAGAGFPATPDLGPPSPARRRRPV